MTFDTDTSAFPMPLKVARMDAVRKLADQLTETTGIGNNAASTIANAAIDPAAVRNALTDPLPGLTAHREAHLQVIPTRVWTPFVTPVADEMMRYASQKRYPVADPSIPATPYGTETADGLAFEWKSTADRLWHLDDNEDIYGNDIHASRLRLFPEKGGIITPVVLAPQTEKFLDGGSELHLLRLVDGSRRYYEVMRMIRQFIDLDQERLSAHLGPDVTPDMFWRAMQRDRQALTKVINAVRAACANAADGMTSAHYLASCLSMPAWIAIGTTDPRTGAFTRMGNGVRPELTRTLSTGMLRWHSGTPAALIDAGRDDRNGILVPSASTDDSMLDSITSRLRARGVAKPIAEFGKSPDVRPAARFVWWCRAVEQLGGTPATAVAGFAETSQSPWPQSISRSLMACASHLMEEDRDTIYAPGDYRKDDARPDSLHLLVSDIDNLTPVASLSADGHGGTLAHPRFRNAAHLALANLALAGALPAQEPLPERITAHTHLLSRVALSWSTGTSAEFVKPDGSPHRDADGRPVLIDERTLTRDDLPWPKGETSLAYMTAHHAAPQGATHVFALRHGVVYTIPAAPADESEITATPESIAKVVRRWFPGATGVVLTDWSDKFITGVMVGSVYVDLFDRKAESEDALNRGNWYPTGTPAGTKDVLEWDSANSGLPVGNLIGAGDWLANGAPMTYMAEAEDMLREELDDLIIQEVDDALVAQRKNDEQGHSGPARNHPDAHQIPVLRLPALKR